MRLIIILQHIVIFLNLAYWLISSSVLQIANQIKMKCVCVCVLKLFTFWPSSISVLLLRCVKPEQPITATFLINLLHQRGLRSSRPSGRFITTYQAPDQSGQSTPSSPSDTLGMLSSNGWKCRLWTLRTSFCRFLPTFIGLSPSDSLWVTNYKRLLLFAGHRRLLCRGIPRCCLYLHPHPTNNNNSSSSSPEPVSVPARLQRWDLLSGAVQEKMAAVSRSAVHICQKVTVQEKMRSRACSCFNALAACAVCHFSYILVIVFSRSSFHWRAIFTCTLFYMCTLWKDYIWSLLTGTAVGRASALYWLLPWKSLAPATELMDVLYRSTDWFKETRQLDIRGSESLCHRLNAPFSWFCNGL